MNKLQLIEKGINAAYKKVDNIKELNFNTIDEELAFIFGDRRYKLKVKAKTTNNNSFLAEYRSLDIYAWFNHKENKYIVEWNKR